MNYLIDTNVISELVKSKPNPTVIQWIDSIPIHSLYLSVLTLGEIRKGIESLADTHRKLQILVWLEHELTAMFTTRILPIDEGVADRWGRLQAQVGRTLPAIDSLIAATALHHDMALVSRNAGDFTGCAGLEIINPWDLG